MAGYYGVCEFVEPPPQDIQTECPVCLSILREPYQTTCCGHSFCRACIEQVTADKNPCPCCKANDFDTFEDKRLGSSLDELKVRCTHKKKGCQWEGDLEQLDEHLNSNPPRHVLKQLEGCQFVDIRCLYCSDLFQRSKVEVHQSSQCPSRPTFCMYCCLLYTSPSPRDATLSRMPSSA